MTAGLNFSMLVALIERHYNPGAAPSQHCGAPRRVAMRTSFFIGLGLVVSLAGSARPQAKSFHLYQQSIRGTLGYGLDGRYTVRPHEIVVTIGDGPVVAHQTVTLHSLRLGICGSSNIFSQELLLNDVSLKPHDSYKLPCSNDQNPAAERAPHSELALQHPTGIEWRVSCCPRHWPSDLGSLRGHASRDCGYQIK